MPKVISLLALGFFYIGSVHADLTEGVYTCTSKIHHVSMQVENQLTISKKMIVL